jgi:hypothetical protein
MKTIKSCLFCLTLAAVSNAALSQQQNSTGDELMVGYYGRPGASSLGVLGQYSIEDLMPLIKAKADEYDQINGDGGVMPAFHLIYGLATGDPGRNKEYLLPLSEKVLMKYINAAQQNGFMVIIDTQLGKLTPIDAIKPVLKYLKYENVLLAIDPEFEVNGLDVRPGKVIGHVTGEQINQVQAAMADYLTENGIKGDKILIVHRFTEGMIKDANTVKPYDQIDLVMNLDGHGSPELKVKIYNSLYTSHASSGSAGGLKLFFQEDKPTMMSPTQVLGMAAVGKSRIKEPPRYINYQ